MTDVAVRRATSSAVAGADHTLAERPLQAVSSHLRFWASPSLLVAALFALAASLSLFVEIPAMVDYVNHLARMHLLAAAGTADANPFYDITWKLYPNLAMDVVVPLLARFMGVEPAARLFLVISQALVVTGAVAIEWAVQGRHRLGGLTALLVLFSTPFAWGLMNFQFGMGVALWAIASWIAIQGRPWPLRLAAHSIFVSILFLSHFFALGLYGATIGLLELSRKRGLAALARVAVLMAAPVAVLLGVMLLTGGAIGGQVTDWSFALKLAWPLRFVNGYSLILSLASAAALLALVSFLSRARAVSLSTPGQWIGTGFLLLYVALPRRLFDTAYIDVRVITAAALILPALVIYSAPTAWISRGAAAVAAAIILVNTAHVATVWLSYRADYEAVKSSFAHVAPGSAVLVAHSGDRPGADLTEQPIYYAPTLAAPYAKAFVPSLYTQAGIQPIAKGPAFRHLEIWDSLDYVPPPVRILKAIAAGSSAEDAPSYLRRWPHDYNYLYLVGPPIPNPLPGLLQEVVSGERFTLYRIKPEPD